MTPQQTLAFIGFAAVIAGTPGPSNALLTATGAVMGVVRGLRAVVGVGVGMAALMFVVVLGIGTLILQTPALLLAIRWTGAAILLWFAWQIARSRGTGATHNAHNARPVGFLGAAAFQWVNPKSWLACTSAAAAYLDPTRGSTLDQATELALVFVLVALPCCFAWLAFGAIMQRALRAERAARIFNLAMGTVLAISAVLFLVD